MMAADLGTPMSPGALVMAANWLQQVVSGNAAMALGVIAVAALGLAMFNGQLPVRRGLTVVAGCFLLFGAPSIGRALMGLPDGEPGHVGSLDPGPNPQAAALPAVPKERDPYAGAGLVTP
ncbi:MAG: TrbC/VirB2 family protein [Sphingomonadales bacterium]|jgi:type IV secretory pathway VirB2 component (pilin)